MHELIEFLFSDKITRLSALFTSMAAVVGLFNIRSWIRQARVNKRADLSAQALDEMALFYSRLEELIEWQFSLSWEEWGRLFREEFRKNFLVSKLKAHRLNQKRIDTLLIAMEECIKPLAFLHKQYIQAHDQKDGLYATGLNAEELHKEFFEKWEKFKKLWEEFNTILSGIGLFKK